MALSWHWRPRIPLRAWTPWLVLATALVATALWSLHLRESAAEKERLRFQTLSARIQSSIETRVERYIGLVRAERGLFAALGGLDAEAFRIFVEGQDLPQRYPGIQGMGFARPEADEDGRLVARVLQVEPGHRLNWDLVGTDLAVDAGRREALQRARDTGLASASPRVAVFQELEETPQPGFQIFLPVYTPGAPQATIEERRAALIGFAFATFQARDLLDGLLGPQTAEAIRLRIFDGLDRSPENLLYESPLLDPLPAGYRPLFTEETVLEVAGRAWGLSFVTLPGFERAAETTLLPFVLLAGLLVAALLFTVTRAEVEARQRAESIAAQLRRSEERLRQSEWRLRSLVEADIIGISIGELGGRIEEANDAFLEMVGYSRSEVEAGRLNWLDLTPEEYRPLDAAAREEMLRTDRHVPYEKELLRRDGRRLPVLVGTAALDAEQGVSFCLDLTERKSLEEALQQRVAELHEADRRKNEFLAMLGHELRNPLAPILSAVEILRLSEIEEPRLAWATEVVERQALTMKHLVDDLLDVSRITRGTIVLRRETLDLTQVVEQAAESVRGLMTERQHELLVEAPPPSTAKIAGDPVRLEQILVNLLNNAAKYTDSGGRVELVARREGEEAVIVVRDTGMGIRPDLLPNVFDLFTQGQKTLDRAHGGLGLGLTLVRRLVELHGGSIAAHSEGAGKGSTFTVRLPLLAADEAQTGEREEGVRA
jgi:PAS domain S-box-containing protein